MRCCDHLKPSIRTWDRSCLAWVFRWRVWHDPTRKRNTIQKRYVGRTWTATFSTTTKSSITQNSNWTSQLGTWMMVYKSWSRSSRTSLQISRSRSTSQRSTRRSMFRLFLRESLTQSTTNRWTKSDPVYPDIQQGLTSIPNQESLESSRRLPLMFSTRTLRWSDHPVLPVCRWVH